MVFNLTIPHIHTKNSLMSWTLQNLVKTRVLRPMFRIFPGTQFIAISSSMISATKPFGDCVVVPSVPPWPGPRAGSVSSPSKMVAQSATGMFPWSFSDVPWDMGWIPWMSRNGIFMVMECMEYWLVPSSVNRHGKEITELNGHLYMGKSSS